MFFNTDPDFGKTMGPDMVLSSGGVWMSPWHQVAVKVIQVGMDPASALPSDTNMAPDLRSHRTFNGNTDPGCSRALDPCMDLSCSSGLGITMALGSSEGHSDQLGFGCSMILGHQQELRWLT